MTFNLHIELSKANAIRNVHCGTPATTINYCSTFYSFPSIRSWLPPRTEIILNEAHTEPLKHSGKTHKPTSRNEREMRKRSLKPAHRGELRRIEANSLIGEKGLQRQNKHNGTI